MVLNTQCFLCLWLSIRFHAKIINQNTKKKALIYNVGSRHEKSPKLAEKNGSLNRELLGIWHIGWFLVNPHVQTKLWAAEVDPRFQKKFDQIAVLQKKGYGGIF